MPAGSPARVVSLRRRVRWWWSRRLVPVVMDLRPHGTASVFPKICWTDTLPPWRRGATTAQSLSEHQGETENVRDATGHRPEEPIPDGGRGRQILLVVCLWQERQPAALRRLAQGQRLQPRR